MKGATTSDRSESITVRPTHSDAGKDQTNKKGVRVINSNTRRIEWQSSESFSEITTPLAKTYAVY